jgi:alkanesulfonate monooxygenase SsuD/methylene tetrahydromethanopterin reductase-like flavin-dependent oxidoreductase (luciferase family)
LREPTVAGLAAAATKAQSDGIDAVFLGSGPLGDPITLASGLSTAAPSILLGILTNLTTEPHRHPTVLAREMTTFDLICGGRALLAFTPPLGDEVIEAMSLCRAMWSEGVAASSGPNYPVAGAINRPRPIQRGSLRIALDLTDGIPADPALLDAADLILVRAGPNAVPATLTALPPGTELCQIQMA